MLGNSIYQAMHMYRAVITFAKQKYLGEYATFLQRALCARVQLMSEWRDRAAAPLLSMLTTILLSLVAVVRSVHQCD